jgi:hypothetical protein
MVPYVLDERLNRVRLALGFNLESVGPDIAHEAVEVVFLGNAAHGVAKEHALD